MASHRGSPRKLTDAQIRRVLRWHARVLKFRARRGTTRDLAARLHVNTRVIYYYLSQYKNGTRGSRSELRPPMRRSTGRPRLLGDRELRTIFHWYVRQMRFLAAHGSARALAHELGVSETTLFDCIRRQGRYRQARRLRRASITLATDVGPKGSRGKESCALAKHESATCWRAQLLNRWARPKP
jgi:hypothetical protein